MKPPAPETLSPAASIASLPPATRKTLLNELSPSQSYALLYDWSFWARPKQLAPPGDWLYWLILAGRGYGKTRTGSEWVRDQVQHHSARRVALVARTAADARDTMIEGESGILAVCPQSQRPRYEPSKRRLTWPNGAIATTYSGDQPDQLRGPSHHIAWADELAAWRYPDTWDQLLFGLRLGTRPRVCITTTPRPTPLIKRLARDPHTALVTGHTRENAANLAPTALAMFEERYAGTRLGRQELAAEILEDNPHALWNLDDIAAHRVDKAPPLRRIVVAIDPAVTADETSDETGIIAAGISPDDHVYILRDHSMKASPLRWAQESVKAYHQHQADTVVAETNNGGELVRVTLRSIDDTIAYRSVHASRGKLIRAEPVSALYARGRVHHVGVFPQLEDQMTDWDPTQTTSPDRLDAMVWAVTELALARRKAPPARSYQG